GFATADELASRRDRADGRHAGLVICRQRPGTAKGTVFLTLEDESGFCNVVVWPDVYEKHHVLVKAEPFLAVEGRIQRQDGVVHLVAKRIWVPQVEDVPVTAGSRDFH
ncbi:MAG: OB-fold nucleic acid binding domain-containing protein, partial [Planctomycetota bacterium]|nr:OB-fold nucleic acid binding domain-containing protein [Planctomycetota bacterium]